MCRRESRRKTLSLRERGRERLKENIRRNDRVAVETRRCAVYFGPSLISPHIGRVEMISFRCLFLCGFLSVWF